MKPKPPFPRSQFRFGLWPVFMLMLIFSPRSARASLFHGETLDTIADVMTWVVLIVAPIVGIAVFLLIHILPEKIAEKKQHPQTKAIQCLCLLSLVFGGLLWPLAWLWAYSKPVLHKLAYGTDRVPHGSHEPEKQTVEIHETEIHEIEKHELAPPARAPMTAETEELRQLRKRITELETKLASKSVVE